MTKKRTPPIPSEPISAKLENYTKNLLQTDSNPATMEVSKSPAKESSDKANTARHDSLVYKVEEIAWILAISSRAAYNLIWRCI